MKAVLSSLVCWARHGSTRDFCPALAALVGPRQNNFFPSVHYFTSVVPNGQQPEQAGMPHRLSLNICLWSRHNICVLYGIGRFPYWLPIDIEIEPYHTALDSVTSCTVKNER
jgi:hypothetical protein